MPLTEITNKLSHLIDRIKYYNENPPMLETLETLKGELDCISETLEESRHEKSEIEWEEGYESGCNDIINFVLKKPEFKTRGDMIKEAENIKRGEEE